MQTKITMLGKNAGVEHKAIFESESSPEQIFSELPGGITDLFARETGVQCPKVQFDIEFQRKTSFGSVGFQTDSIDMAIIRSKEMLKPETDVIDDLLRALIRQLPSPEILHTQAVLAYASKNIAFVNLICDLLVAMGEAADLEIRGQKFKNVIFEKIKQDAKELMGEE